MFYEKGSFNFALNIECCCVGMKLWFQRIINANKMNLHRAQTRVVKQNSTVIYHFHVGTSISLSIKMGKTLADKRSPTLQQ